MNGEVYPPHPAIARLEEETGVTAVEVRMCACGYEWCKPIALWTNLYPMGPFLRIARAKAGSGREKKSTKPDLSPFFLFLLSSFPSYSQLSFAPIPIENLKFYMKW